VSVDTGSTAHRRHGAKRGGRSRVLGRSVVSAAWLQFQNI
jgi:hypothetical protein